MPTKNLSNTAIIKHAHNENDYVSWRNEVERLIPYGVPERLLHGNLDGFRDGVLHGWLWAPYNPALRLTVALMRNGMFWMTLRADCDREDLREANIGDGCYGFFVALDDCFPGTVIEVYLADTEWLLGRTEVPSAFIDATSIDEVDPLPEDVKGDNKNSSQLEFLFDYDPGIHEIEIIKFFAQYADHRPAPQAPDPKLIKRPVLIIVFSNRSGSNLLSQSLAATGLVHNTGECFNYSTVQDACLKKGIVDMTAYLNYLMSTSRNKNAALALKVSWDQLYFLTRVGVIPSYWQDVRFVWSLREDLLAQALSALVAERTQCWSQAYPSEILSKVLLRITPEDLAMRVQQISHALTQLHTYFAVYDLYPVLVEYDDLARDPEKEAFRVLNELDLIPYRSNKQFDQGQISVCRQRTPAMEQRLEELREKLRL